MNAAPQLQYDDNAARERIRSSLAESLIVEAAAGTGKTTEMVRRIVAVLAQGLAAIDRVVAVTFTRKAAGELKLRLRQELDRARNAAPEASVERANLERALARLEEARVGTIHSFCAEILRERPVEAVIDPAFQELSEPQAGRLYARAFQGWAQEKLAAGAPGLQRALARLGRLERSDPRSPLAKLQEAGRKLIEWRGFPAPWRREPFDRASDIDDLVGAVESLAARAAQSPYRSDDLVQALRPAQDLAAAIERAEQNAARDYDALEGLLLQLLRDLKRRTKKGRRSDFAPGVRREDVVAERDRLTGRLAVFQRRADADLAAQLREELWDLVGRYDEQKRRAGGLDFVDLLVRVRDLIRDKPEVRRHLQSRFQRIFVDEFQDTDPLQAEILILLSAGDPDQTDFLQVTPAPGKLFVVGDPKQSIYRFRRADVILYQEIRRALESRGVAVVHLSQSFRALRPIQECINAAFAPEIQQNPETGQPHYVPLDPAAPSRDRQGAVAQQPTVIALPAPHPYGYRDISKQKVAQCLPSSIAAFVDWLVNHSHWQVRDPQEPSRSLPIEARHICLLFRHYLSYGTDTTRDYLHELEARGISHVLVGQRSFHQREEVETLRTALAAVEWPADELSVFATLRGSLFGILDAALLRYRETVARLHPFHPLPESLDEDFRPIAQALDLLRRLHVARNHRPVVQTIHELLETTRAHAGFAVRPAGHQVLANIYRLCDLARSYELGGGISFRGFVEELEAHAERPSSDDALTVEEGAEGVRVMTVHTAKGLEFPVVILADITTGLCRDTPDLYIDARRGLCALPLINCSPWDLLDHQSEEAARDQAEGVRIAYVAATRARDLLVVPAVGDEPLKDSWVAPLHKALYPSRQNRRQSHPAPGCPDFGETTILSAPTDYPGGLDFAIRPGVHQPEQGSHQVVWWDPALWNLKVEVNLGLRLETVLAEDADGEAARQSVARYEVWKQGRLDTVAHGVRPRLDLFTATRAPEPPPGLEAPIALESVVRLQGRPAFGPRFGALVHALFRDADLGGDRATVASLARLHARLVGSRPDEISAAIEAVAAALDHPLIARARRAERCYREMPLVFHLEDGRMLEGVLDLAFEEDGAWTIVDFKTDADLESRRHAYERQLQWYVYALGRLTRQPVRGVLLSV